MPRRLSTRVPPADIETATRPKSIAKNTADATPQTPAKRKGTDHDFATVARRVVEQAIGERLDGSPLHDKDEGKNPHAVALGKLGGSKGGKARAEALTPAKRKAIAQKAALARWKRKA
jgi:hypothetical protein